MRFQDLMISNQYRLVRRLGGGTVYFGTGKKVNADRAVLTKNSATDLGTGKEVAVKLEHDKIDPSLLRDEFESRSGEMAQAMVQCSVLGYDFSQ